MCGRLLRVVRRTSQLGRIVRHAGHTQGMRTRPSARRMMAIFVHNDDATRRHPHAWPFYPRARGGWRSRAAATQKRTSDTAIHRPRMRHMYHGTLAPLGSAARFCRFGLIGRRHGRCRRGARSPLPIGPTFPCPSATWEKHRMRVPPIADHRPPPPPPRDRARRNGKRRTYQLAASRMCRGAVGRLVRLSLSLVSAGRHNNGERDTRALGEVARRPVQRGRSG